MPDTQRARSDERGWDLQLAHVDRADLLVRSLLALERAEPGTSLDGRVELGRGGDQAPWKRGRP